MLDYSIIETEAKPKLKFDFRILLGLAFLLIYLVSGTNAQEGSIELFLKKYDGLLILLTLLLISGAVFIYYLDAKFFKLIGVLSINENDFIIKKGNYEKQYSFDEIQEVRYGRNYKGRAYKIEFDDILLYLKLNQEEQKELEQFLEKHIITELEIHTG
jgi:hypothetical protein